MEYEKKVKLFSDLNIHELYEIIKLRIDVFVVEQDCPYSDLDGKDQDALHLYYETNGGEIIAYLRILKKGVSYEESAIGRVITAEKARHLRLGSKIMVDALEIIKNRGERAVRISAQEHLEKFYGNIGFEKVSEMYLEDDIPHIEMLWLI